MDALRKRVLSGYAQLFFFLGVLLFLPAWTLAFWQAWAYWLLFALATLTGTEYFLRKDPGLIARRLSAGPSAEKEKSQKLIQAIAGTLSCLLLIVPGLDHHFHWSDVPGQFSALADIVVILGYLVVFAAFRENRYASSIIETAPDQRVISTGPYRIVRHPMYSGVVVMYLATPIALGSWWGLICAVLLIPVIAARLLHEETFLAANLPGYDEYRRRVRRRLIPCLW